jgi:hypothetical protein
MTFASARNASAAALRAVTKTGSEFSELRETTQTHAIAAAPATVVTAASTVGS